MLKKLFGKKNVVAYDIKVNTVVKEKELYAINTKNKIDSERMFEYVCLQNVSVNNTDFEEGMKYNLYERNNYYYYNETNLYIEKALVDKLFIRKYSPVAGSNRPIEYIQNY
ncbi:hypothetical protein ACMGE9_12350 [Macrococcus sp. EM39E]|uniref:hypothetical protein n=1 Tax=Macrococcus animalis TaxID=3395467 RepID=UPI0039BDCE92